MAEKLGPSLVAWSRTLDSWLAGNSSLQTRLRSKVVLGLRSVTENLAPMAEALTKSEEAFRLVAAAKHARKVMLEKVDHVRRLHRTADRATAREMDANRVRNDARQRIMAAMDRSNLSGELLSSKRAADERHSKLLRERLDAVKECESAQKEAIDQAEASQEPIIRLLEVPSRLDRAEGAQHLPERICDLQRKIVKRLRDPLERTVDAMGQLQESLLELDIVWGVLEGEVESAMDTMHHWAALQTTEQLPWLQQALESQVQVRNDIEDEVVRESALMARARAAEDAIKAYPELVQRSVKLSGEIGSLQVTAVLVSLRDTHDCPPFPLGLKAFSRIENRSIYRSNEPYQSLLTWHGTIRVGTAVLQCCRGVSSWQSCRVRRQRCDPWRRTKRGVKKRGRRWNARSRAKAKSSKASRGNFDASNTSCSTPK